MGRRKAALFCAGIKAVLLLKLKTTPDPAMVKAAVRCYSLSGDTDLLVELVAADVAMFNGVRDHIATLPGMAVVTTALILKRDKQPVVAA